MRIIMTRRFSIDKVQEWLNQGGFDIVVVSFDSQTGSFCRIYTKTPEISGQLSCLEGFIRNAPLEGLENFLVKDHDQDGIGDVLMNAFEVMSLEFG